MSRTIDDTEVDTLRTESSTKVLKMGGRRFCGVWSTLSIINGWSEGYSTYMLSIHVSVY